MIVVDKEKCIRCGSCVEICHEHCMALVDGDGDIGVRIDYELCSTCTQCIAICPEQALSWDHVAPVAYEKTRLPSPQQLDELFKERRTIRTFTKDKIDRTLVEEIVGYGIYSPTNNFALRAIVVDDEEIIRELDRIILQYTLRIYNLFYKPKIVFHLLKRLASATGYLQAKPKLERSLETGYVLRDPAAIVFIAGDRRVPLSEASAQYALCNMILYAQVKGIGSRLWGPGQLFLDRRQAARERLGLQKHEHILGTLVLGHPAVRFQNKVEGKTLSIRWNGGYRAEGP
jgi:NAD-dependent dihydropyrimidine dehydrogenase PreA subunit/nitroreductase